MTTTWTHHPTTARPAAPADEIDALLAETIGRLDPDALRDEFEGNGRLLVLADFLPRQVLDALLADVERTRTEIHRNLVPGQKKGGAVSRFSLDRVDAAAARVYRSPALRRFVEAIVGEQVQACPSDDPHTYALYHYSEPGDHIGWHWDTSFYRGRRYTLLLGLVSNESCMLECDLHKRDDDRPTERRSYQVTPGTFVLFDGDRLWHRVTPMRAGDGERVVLTFELVTDPTMHPWRRLISNVKDSVAYFGFWDTFVAGKRRQHA